MFPGILGRVCDRPCEPACRRGRVEDKPVAICRLKRVAADNCGDISARLPQGAAREERQAHRAHRRGLRVAHGRERSRAAWLRVRDLRSARPRPAGSCARTSPLSGCRPRCSTRRSTTSSRIGVDAQAVVAGARACARCSTSGSTRCSSAAVRRRARTCSLPGRDASDRIHIGIDWLGSIAFGHVDVRRRARADHRRRQHRDGLLPQLAAARCKRRQSHRAQAAQLLQGVGLGARGRGGRARRDRREPLAEGIRDRERQARRHEVRRARVRARRGRRDRRDRRCCARCSCRATTSCSRSARRMRSRGSSAMSASRSTSTTCRSIDPVTFESTRPGVFFGGDSAFGPKNIIWAVEHGHQAAISIHKHCEGTALERAAAARREPADREDGNPRVELQQRLRRRPRAGSCRTSISRAASRSSTSRWSSDSARSRFSTEVERCLNCDLQTVFTAESVHRVRRVHRHLSRRLPRDHAERRSSPRSSRGSRRRASNPEQPFFVSAALKQTGRVMLKDENLCVHCGLCAERCPTGAWDMQKSTVKIPYAGDEATAKARTEWQSTRKAG